MACWWSWWCVGSEDRSIQSDNQWYCPEPYRLVRPIEVARWHVVADVEVAGQRWCVGVSEDLPDDSDTSEYADKLVFQQLQGLPRRRRCNMGFAGLLEG